MQVIDLQCLLHFPTISYRPNKFIALDTESLNENYPIFRQNASNV